MNEVIPHICHCCRWFVRNDSGQSGKCHYLPIEVEKFLMDGCSKFEASLKATPQGRECIPSWQQKVDGFLFTVVHKDGSEWTSDQLERYAIDNCPTLVYCDIDGFYLDIEGNIFLADECGNFTYINDDDFIVKWLVKSL